jgi:hypothetical protein
MNGKIKAEVADREEASLKLWNHGDA